MPFIAKDKTTGERIDISQYPDPRLVLVSANMVCPVCEQGMIIKAGSIIQSHFAHKPGRDDCPYAAYSAGESPAHRAAKLIVRDALSDWFKEYIDAEGSLEVYIPDVMHARNRIADILFSFPNGWRVAHEIQLAPITPAELQERSDDYMSAGIDCFWWFGGRAATDENLRWSGQRYGYHLVVRFDEGIAGVQLGSHESGL